jgi:hypothetical protein
MTRLKWRIIGILFIILALILNDSIQNSEIEFQYLWAKLHLWNQNSGNFDLVSNAKIQFKKPFLFEFTTNSDGLRYTPRYPSKEDWKSWIVGDSFVLGYGVNDSETISNQLEFPNLNLSLDAMGSQIAYEKITFAMSKFPQPETIIWFYNSSDLIDDQIYKNGYKDQRNKTKFLRELMISNRFTYSLFYLYKLYSNSKLPNQYDSEEIIIPELDHPTFEGIQKMKILCDQNKIQFVIVFLPEVIPKDKENLYWAKILSNTKKLNIQHLDYHNLYDPEKYHLPNDMHPNSEAYKMISNAISNDFFTKIGNTQKVAK